MTEPVDLRGLVVRGVVHRLDDTGPSQALDVETHEGVLRSGVLVLLPYGLASAPAAGGLTVLLAVGGDQGDMVALPVAGGTRYAVGEGEAALYTDEGTRVHLRAGGVVEIAAATEVVVTVGATVWRVGPAGVSITGNLAVNGNIAATGTITP